MKNYLFSLILILTTIIVTSCDKEEKIPESVALKYVDVNPDTTFIDVNLNDTIKFTCEEWIVYNGSHPYSCSRIKIGSNYPNKIKLSFGKIYDSKFIPLNKYSIIDKSLDWYDSYVVGGYIQGPIGFQSEYIGIKITDNEETYYGWIHTPNYFKITEYAIDTNLTIKRTIKAGIFEK